MRRGHHTAPLPLLLPKVRTAQQMYIPSPTKHPHQPILHKPQTSSRVGQHSAATEPHLHEPKQIGEHHIELHDGQRKDIKDDKHEHGQILGSELEGKAAHLHLFVFGVADADQVNHQDGQQAA